MPPVDDFYPEPALLVGVGGSGCAIVDHLLGIAQGLGRAKDHRIRVLGIDTDVEDLKHHRYLKPEHILRIGASDDVYRMWERNRPGVEDWFLDYDSMTPDIRRMSVGTGAGQIRMLSALSFTDSMNDRLIEDSLDRVVKSINERSSAPMMTGPMNIFIVGSMAGGTGSGVFMALAWLLARKFRSLGGVVPVVRGLFLMGDVFCYAARLPTTQMDNVRTNTYAALAELNAAVLEAARKLPRPVEFRHLNRGNRIADDNIPFEEVILVDYNDRIGGSLGPNLENYYNKSAAILYHMAFTSVGSRYRSLFANDILIRSGGTACGKPRLYSGVGVSDLFYPRADILHYLCLRVAKQAMQDDWLDIDQDFEAETARWLRRRMDGLDDPEPSKARHFVESVRNRGRQPGNYFYRAILDAVEIPPPPFHERGDGAAITRLTHEEFLKAFSHRIEQTFFEQHSLLASWRDATAPDDGKVPAELVQWVALREKKLNGVEPAISDALVSAPGRLFRDLFMTQADTADAMLKPFHLEYYIRKEGPHPVRIRFFLYSLLLHIDDELRRLGPGDEFERLIDEASRMAGANSQDGTLERSRRAYTNRIQKRADIAAQNRNFLRMGRAKRDFCSEYKRYYSNSLTIIHELLTDGLYRRLCREMRVAVEKMLIELEEFFKIVGRLTDRINRDIIELEDRYDGERDSAAVSTSSVARSDEQRAFWIGNIPVYASRTAMRKIWGTIDEGRRLNQNQPVLEGLALSLCQRFRSILIGRNGGIGGDYEELFRRQVVDGYCRQQIETDWKAAFDIDVTEALRREAELLELDWRVWLSDRIRRLREQSAPLIATASDRNGSRVVMWAMNINSAAKLLNRHDVDPTMVESDAELTSYFSIQPGDRLAVRSMYATDRLTCIQFRNNLELSELVKLDPGFRGEHYNVSDVSEGRYHRAYARTLERLRGQDPRHSDGRVCVITPHLHRDWHLPGYLPDIFEATAQTWRDRSLLAFVQGLALDVLKTGGLDASIRGAHFHYDDTAWPGSLPSRRKEIVGPTNDFALRNALDLDPPLVEWIHSVFSATSRTTLEADEPLKSSLFEALKSPALSRRIAGIAVDDRSEAAITLAAEATRRLIDLVNNFVTLAMRGSGTDIRLETVMQSLQGAVAEADKASKIRSAPASKEDRATKERERQYQKIFKIMQDIIKNWLP